MPPLPGANVLQSITPTLPVYLNITLDRAVMMVDETAVVTVSLYSTAALTKKQLKLVLDVPNALITTTSGKGKLRWDVPDLSAGQIFQQQITVRMDKAKKALKQGVVRFTATSNAVGHKALMTEKLLGIVSATSVTDGTQSADGTVLRDVERGITLLTPPGATQLGVALHYKPRFRAPRQKKVKLATPPAQKPWLETARVTFTHDATGNLTKVEHPIGLGIGTTTMTYDLLGHKTSMNDVDMGHWTYAYDRQGKLTSQTDACGNLTVLTYENVLAQVNGKQFQKGHDCSYVVAPQYNVTFLYGQAGVSRGRLTQVRYTDGSYQKDIGYDGLGLLSSETVKIDGAPQSYTTYYGYDVYQRPNVIVYPDGEWVTTTYNSMGLPNRLKNNQNGDLVDGLTASGSVPNGVTYDEAGRVTQMRFPLGGNLYQTQQYAPFGQQDSNAGHLTSLKVGTNSNPANSDSWNHTYQNYWYDSFGNITQVDDQGAGTYSLSYDAQNRLLNSYGRSYTYDAAGRLTNYEGAGLTPSPDNPHAMAPDWSHYVLDLNGNYDARLQGSGQQAFTWTVDNHLQRVSWGYGEESYLYDADGQRIKKSNRYGDVTFYPFPNYEVTNDVAWVDDAIPGGSVAVADSDGWVWDNGTPVSGASYHRSPSKAGAHQHYFYGATQPLKVNTGDALYAYVYLDPNNPPSELMFQWYDSSSGWEHRAYWGQNLIGAGTNGANSRRYMGALPATGGWVRLEVPASQVGLEGVNVTGMAFTLYNGQAWWDRAGKRSATWLATKAYAFNGQRIALRDETGLYYLHQDQLGSTMATTNESGNTVADHGYYAYGRDRRGSELRTDRRFTGQQSDASGLIYMNARYYDPQIGQFISPDTLVPDATNLFDYNRYMYARGNPMKYNDPTGHCIAQGQDGWDSTENTQCYADAYTIANLGGLDYIQKYFGGGYKSVDQWLKTALSDPNLDGNFLHPHAGPLYQNWCSSVGLIGQAGCSGTYTPNPVPPQPYLHCDRNCLISLGIDTIGVGASLAVVSGSTLCGPGAPVCVAILTQGGTAVGILSTLGGVIWTGYLNQQHQVTDADINMTMAVAGANLLPPLGATRPVVGLVANLVQLTWDIPKHPSLNKPELSEQTHDP